jgi:hypothetical protein
VQVENEIAKLCTVADRVLSNNSRQKHSNMQTPGRPDSFVWGAADIHKLPKRKQSNRAKGRQKDKLRERGERESANRNEQ